MELKPGYKQTEVGVIPEDWEVKLLPEVLRFRGGKAHEQYITDAGPYVCVNSKFISSDGQVRKHCTANFCPAKKGDVLMVMSDLPNGRALAKTYLVEADDTYAVNQRVCALTAYRDCPEYFFYVLNRHPYFLKYDDGVSQTHLLNNVFQKCPIPAPSDIDEQRAIATALSDVDALLDGLDRLIAKKRDLKQAAMQQLLTGETRLPGFKGEWVECKLIELANFYDNLRIPVTESKREIGITPYYGANGIQGYIKGHTHDGEFVLIAEDGANDLSNYPVFYVNGKVWVNNHAHVIQGIPNKAKTKYLSYALKNVDFVQVLVGGTRAKLNGSEAKAIKIIIPSDIEEQTVIATVLSDMDAEIAALEQRRNKTKEIKQAMMQELLTGKTRLVTPGGSNA